MAASKKGRCNQQTRPCVSFSRQRGTPGPRFTDDGCTTSADLIKREKIPERTEKNMIKMSNVVALSKPRHRQNVVVVNPLLRHPRYTSELGCQGREEEEEGIERRNVEALVVNQDKKKQQ